MKIGSRHILFRASSRGNYCVMNNTYGRDFEKSKHRNRDHLMRKGLASKLRHILKHENEEMLNEL